MGNGVETLTVVGVGGVGGLLSAPLIRRYGGAVSLVARGKRRESLMKNGLHLRSEMYGDFVARPKTVAEQPNELPVQDAVLVCVKNNTLDDAARDIAPLVGPKTIVLPIMNGVTAGETLRRTLKGGIVLESVLYTVSSVESDFSVTQTGSFTYLFAGAISGGRRDQEAAVRISGYLRDAGIDCRQTDRIREAIWNKYVLNCAYNVVTARWGVDIGEVKADKGLMEDCRYLMQEARTVALAKGVELSDDLVERNLKRIRNTDDHSSSSLSRDFAARRAGELEVFSGDVVRMAAEKHVSVPVTKVYYDALTEIASKF